MEIPLCEVCHKQFSADLHAGDYRYSLTRFKEKTAEISYFKLLLVTGSAFGLIATVIVLVQTVAHLLSRNISGYLYFLFGEVIFPLFFFFRSTRKIGLLRNFIKDCRMEIISVTLRPRRYLTL